jgi:hypothetical protein
MLIQTVLVKEYFPYPELINLNRRILSNQKIIVNCNNYFESENINIII